MGMFDMLGKINELRGKMTEVKTRLDSISVSGEAGNGLVKISMTANQNITSVDIQPVLLHPDRREELQDLLEIAFNEAAGKARNVAECEMKAAGKGLLPDIPGLF
jgi:hypothetical protein